MRRRDCLLTFLLACTGCAPWRAPLRGGHQHYPNPLPIPIRDPEYVWEKMVSVVDDYFVIDREERARWVGDVLVEGYLETRPLSGATVLEPWHDDSVTRYDRWEATLQTIRRRAVVRVTPDQDGFLVEIAVYKELEDLPRPQQDTAGGATFRYDDSLERYREPVADPVATKGWISLGRDTALEQEMLARLQGCLGDGR